LIVDGGGTAQGGLPRLASTNRRQFEMHPNEFIFYSQKKDIIMMVHQLIS